MHLVDEARRRDAAAVAELGQRLEQLAAGQSRLAQWQQLAELRPVSAEIIDLLKRLPPPQHPMETLRTAVSALSLYDPEAEDMSEEANRRKALRLTGQMGTIVAAFGRIREGKGPLAPDPKLDHAANFLYMLQGKVPHPEDARWFDVALILHADHSYNASTFAARVTAVTLSDIYSAVTSAIGALKGPLHGGANEDVIRRLLSTKSADDAVEKVRQDLGKKIKIAGFGHRVYRTVDPRAIHLKKMSEELGRRTGHTELYEKSARVEQTVHELKDLNANVDFYSASTYYSLGIPVDLFTPIFAVSRRSRYSPAGCSWQGLPDSRISGAGRTDAS